MPRNNNIVIKSQFNINGSRGKSVKKFIVDYVSRETATKGMYGYKNPNVHSVEGDGVCFTFSESAITRDKVYKIADHVEDRFLNDNRAIQQLVISFDSNYLREMNVVDNKQDYLLKGDYEDNYDDVRLRHVIRKGIREIAERDGFREPKMIGTIQYDTNHLHSHVVLYEDSDVVGRKRGREEKGVIKSKSFEYGALEMDRVLERTKKVNVTREKMQVKESVQNNKEDVVFNQLSETGINRLQEYLDLIYLQKLREEEEKKEREILKEEGEDLFNELFGENR